MLRSYIIKKLEQSTRLQVRSSLAPYLCNAFANWVLYTTLPLDAQGGIQGGLELSVRFGNITLTPYGFRLSSE